MNESLAILAEPIFYDHHGNEKEVTSHCYNNCIDCDHQLQRIKTQHVMDGEFLINFIPQPRHNSCRKGVCGKVQFLHGYFDVSYR